MKMHMAQVGAKVYSKVNEGFYRITEINEKGALGMRIVESPDGIPDWYDKDYTIDDNDCVFITKDNAIAFRFIDNPVPLPIPEEYSVENGILLKNGRKATEQGELVIKKILDIIPGGLILSVEVKTEFSENKDIDVIDLFTYRVNSDRFSKQKSGIPEPSIIFNDDDNIVLQYNATQKAVIKNNDGTEENYETPGACGFIVLNAQTGFIRYEIPFLSEVLPDKPKIINPIGKQNGFYIYYQVCKTINEDYVIKDCSEYVKCIMISPERNDVKHYYEITDILSARTSSLGAVITSSDRITIINGDKTYTVNNAEIIEAVTGLEIPVDFTTNNGITKISLADDIHNVKIIEIEQTKDRGKITRIVEATE